MRVKWNRNLDGNVSSDSGQSPSSDSNRPENQTLIKEVASSPTMGHSRSRKHNTRKACDLVFGPRRISPGALRATVLTRRSSFNDDRRSLARLSSFLGLFKLSDGKNRQNDDIPSIKVIRRGVDSYYEPEMAFQTDSKRRRRANSLLQRHSAIRRSWNQMNMQNSGGGGSLGRSWLPSSPYLHQHQGRFRATSPSGTSTSTKSWKISEDIYGDGSGKLGNGSVSPSETSQFGNSCKVNSMPAPIVTLPECVLDDDEEEESRKLQSKTDKMNQADDEVDNGTRRENSKQQQEDINNSRNNNNSSGENREISQKSNDSDKSDYDAVDNAVDSDSNKHDLTTSKSIALNDDCEDVFIQVRITSSSPVNHYYDKSSSSLVAQRSSSSSTARSSPKDRCHHQASEFMDTVSDDAVDKLALRNDDNSDASQAKKTPSNVGSLDRPLNSPTSQQTIRKEFTSTTTITRSPSSSPSQSTYVSEPSKSLLRTSSAGSYERVKNGNLQESHHHLYDQPYSSTTSFTSSSSIQRSDTDSPSPSRSRPKPISVVPFEYSDPGTIQDEAYLYSEPQKSEIIRVTVRKAQIPEVVHLKRAEKGDLDSENNDDLNDENNDLIHQRCKPTVPNQRHQRTSRWSGSYSQDKGREESPTGSNSGIVRQGILKDSNGLNGLHYRNGLPKKVHFAESTKVTSHSRFTGSTLQESSTSSSVVTCFSPTSDKSVTEKTTSFPMGQSDGTTITASSTLTIRKSPRKMVSNSHQSNILV